MKRPRLVDARKELQRNRPKVAQGRRNSAYRVFREGLAGNRNWQRNWRDPEPQESYDIIIIGGGGHGLSTAYYLASQHGLNKVAVLERGYFGGGNVGRNTTIIRSNYMVPGNTLFYELSLQLWESLSHELNYNMMVSHRGHLVLAHSPPAMDALRRRANTMWMNGIDVEVLTREEVRRLSPNLNFAPSARFPIHGATWQERAGSVRHDAVAWGFARAADSLGVDILQNTEVTGFVRQGDKITGVQTNRGTIHAERIGMAVAGRTSQVAAMAGLRLPIESHLLQAFVSEPIKPCLDQVVSSTATHFYISQSDRGGLVFGGHLDGYNSYSQRGSLPLVQEVMAQAQDVFPPARKVRLLRHWAGIMDMTMDGSPIIAQTPLDGLYLNGGWCYGGFKATPASGFCFAHLLATDEPHPVAAQHTLSRFAEGALIDEEGTGALPKAH